jgi:Matrixin
MKISAIVLPAAAAGAAALLLLPTHTDAWVALGGSLGLDQRDVRVFNNFTDAAANNNTTPSADFPGYVGAELACWKAVVEWGSRLHGDGGGDPLEGLIGSGGANFDPSWQGNAVGVGGSNDNIISQLNGNGGGVYAFTESPISDGWRIRFYQDPWIWQDGPGDEDGGSNRVDIQGILTHEYGHALGLDHTGVGGATMFAGVSPEDSSTLRSIAADDIAGVQGVYGVASASKPVITAVARYAQNIEITGTHFDANDNEVWFTQDTAGGSGTPVKVFNMPSSGGVIEAQIPAGAGSGDVLVRVPGNSGSDLSNAFPFNINSSGFQTFCNGSDNAILFCPCGNSGAGDTGCDNPQGTGGVKAEITVWFPNGPSALLTCTGFPPASNPTVVILRGAGLVPTQVIFGDGLRCVDVPIVRLAATSATGGVSNHSFGHGAGPGTFYYQAWYRSTPISYCDPTAAFNLSSGVAITWP